MFKMIYNIARTELQMLFYSPVAWLILVVFGVQSGMLFADMMKGMVWTQEMGYPLSAVTYRVFADLMYGGVFARMQSFLYFYIPLLTMGLVSRELSSGSIRLLYSSPITNFQIIMGKYLSMMIYGAFMMGILLLAVICGWSTIKDFDWPMVFTGLLGLYLLICAYAAIGIFMSSLTSYQIVAAIGTFAVLMILSMIGGWWQEYDFIRDVTYWLSINGRCSTFIGGLICSEDVLYFVIVVCLFLTLTIIRLNAVRQKIRFSITLGRNVGVILLACFLGYLSALPTLMVYYDATETKMNTLTPNSQEIVAKLDGKVTITTYINVLGRSNWYASPSFVKPDMERFKQYLRFKPDMKLKYVYYYDTTNNPSLDRRFPDLTLREKMVEVCKIYGLDSNKFKGPEEIREMIDLSGEGNDFVRQIVRENGEKTWLRIYDDMERFPGEPEISAAFKRLVMILPKVGVLAGHGERSYRGNKDRDYSLFANERTFRYALLNQGFDVDEVKLDREVPDDINILVISDMREWLQPEEEARLQQYIDRGGNLVVMGEPRRREVMNHLFGKFGFELVPGILVKHDTNRQADILLSYPTKEAGDIAYEFDVLYKRGYVVTTPSCSGLEQVADKGFKVTELFKSDTIGSWNELETTDFVDDTVRLNPAIGEVEKSYPTIVALSRKVGNREQKILLTGDADCISNSEFNRRVNVRTSNYTLITGSFFWLSDNEVPIDVRRPEFPDNGIYIGSVGEKVIKGIYMVIIPLLFMGLGIFIWIRRKGR